MCPKAVILNRASPVGVDHTAAFLFRSDTVSPVIFIRKAAARPAKYREFQCAKRIHNILAHSILVRNLGILPHINTVINAAAKMLRKLPIYLRSNMT